MASPPTRLCRPRTAESDGRQNYTLDRPDRPIRGNEQVYIRDRLPKTVEVGHARASRATWRVPAAMDATQPRTYAGGYFVRFERQSNYSKQLQRKIWLQVPRPPRRESENPSPLRKICRDHSLVCLTTMMAENL